MHKSISIFILMFSHIANADMNACLSEKYEDYTQARKAYQIELANYIIAKYPEYEPTSKMYMNDQLLRIDKRLLSFRYLLKNDPETLLTDKTISQWVSTTEDQEASISSVDARYSQILDEISESKNRPSDPLGDDLRNIMRSEIMQSSEFLKIMTIFSNKAKEINEIQCK